MAGKKLVGIYLPKELVARFKKFIMQHYLKTGEEKSQSEVVEEALTKFLDDAESKDMAGE